mgnify:FL=1|jgi:hypothetical protein
MRILVIGGTQFFGKLIVEQFTPILDWLRVTTQWLLENQQADSDGYKERHAEIKAAERWRRT